jgi:hypothetical protein
MEFLLSSKFVDFYGSVPTGNEIHFFWKTTKNLPALEIRVIQSIDGSCHLTYIKEASCDGKEEFIWDNEWILNQKGAYLFTTKTN